MPAYRKLDLELCATAGKTCTASNLRKAARAITGLFDDALRPTGLRISQLGILVALALAEEASVSRLAALLTLDRTTMTRNLTPLERRGFVETVSGGDARRRALRLTGEGRAALSRALPVWQRVQRRVVSGLGDSRWRSLLRGLRATVALAQRG